MGGKWYHINTNMIACKLAFAFVNGKDSCYLPYMVLFLINIGLTPSQAGIINGVRFFGSIIGAPVWGMVADQKSVHLKVALCIGMVAMLFQGCQPVVAYVFKRYYETETTALFYILLVLNILAMFFDSNLISFVDTGAMKKIESYDTEQRPDFGQQRLFGSLGYGTATMLSSVIISVLPQDINFSSYSVVLFIYVIYTVGVCVTITIIYRSLGEQQEEQTVRAGTRHLLWEEVKKAHNLFFFATVLCIGTVRGFYISFFPILIKELDGPESLVGLCVLIGALLSATFIFLSRYIFRVFATKWSILNICMLSWALRFIGFYFVRSPWLILPLQLLQGLGFGLTIVTYVTHTKEITPAEILTSMCSISNMLFFFAGNGIANIFGGMLYAQFDIRKVFLALSMFSLFWCFLLLVYTYRCLPEQKNTPQTEQEAEEIEMMFPGKSDEPNVNC